MMTLRKLASTLLLGLFTTILSSGNAVATDIYKCVDATGQTIYSQTACGLTSEILVRTRTQVTANDNNSCDLAERFALTVSQSMREGKTSGYVFRRYGGMDSMEGSALALVNYVYTFRDNYLATTERIASLTGTRCLAGSFGSITCKKFPRAFLGEVGGCDMLNRESQPHMVSQVEEE